MSTVAELEEQIRQLRLQALPADQRPAFQVQMDIEAQRAAMAAERQNLDKAALAITAHELAFKTGKPVEEFMKHTSIGAMQTAAADMVLNMKPEEYRALAELHEKIGGGAGDGKPELDAEGKPVIKADPAAAAGAETKPAGVTTTTAGAAVAGADPGIKVDEAFKGKGQGSIGEWLAERRAATPITDIHFGGDPAQDITAAAAAPDKAAAGAAA